MFLFPILAESISEGATTGIAASSAAVAGAVLVFVLAKVAGFLQTAGSLQTEITLMSDLAFTELRLQIKFFNSTSNDLYYSDFAVYRKDGKHYILISPLDGSPIETGGSMARWDYATNRLVLKSGSSYFGIFHFGEGGSFPIGVYYLGMRNKKGKLEIVQFRR